MGTRGFVGFAVRGEVKITYNHFDSYPDGLGAATLAWLREHLLHREDGTVVLHPEVAGMIARLQMVDSQDMPTEAQREALAAFTDPNVGGRGGEEWYAVLRECQGDLDATLRAGYMIDSSEFPLESLFCEWGYLIDADASVFEVYKGFNQTDTPTAGRWAGVRNPDREIVTRSDGSTYVSENYQPVQRIWAIPFAELPTNALDFGAGVAARQRPDPAEVEVEVGP
jgi:hypothetical protein